MNSTTITTHIGLTLGTLSLALLTACGGGGGDEPALANVPPAELATGAAVATLCGVQAAPAQGASGYSVSANQTVIKDGLPTLVSMVTSLTGNTDGSETVSLDVPMQDMREVPATSYAPLETFDTMSVEMGSSFKAGAVGCIQSVARLTPTGTEDSMRYLLSWKSDSLASLPVSVSDTEPREINGFEFVSNFDATNATAVFRMDMRYLVTANEVRVCRVTSSTSRTCSVPTVTNDGSFWTFRMPITQAGVYFLIAPRETPI